MNQGLTTKLRRGALAVQSWYFDPAPVAPLVVCRMGLGLIMVLAYAFYWPHVEPVFGARGLSAYLGDGTALIHRHTWWVYWTLIVAASAFTVGLLTPVAGMVTIACHLSFLEATRLHTWGWAPTVPAFLFYTSISPAWARCSVDRWILDRVRRKRGKPAVEMNRAPAWPMRLMQVHIAATYVGAAWHRIHDGAWWRGEMVYEALTFTFFARFPDLDWFAMRPVLALACWAVWLLELSAPLLLWVPRTRVVWALGLMAMHAGLELTATIGWWQYMMMVVLFVFLPADWSEAIVGKVARLGTRARRITP